MANLKLDTSRAFDECHPPENGAHYHQGGLYFRADGTLLDGEQGEALMGKDAKERVRAAEKHQRAQERANKAYAEEMAKSEEDERKEAIEQMQEAAKVLAKDPPQEPIRQPDSSEASRNAVTQDGATNDTPLSDAEKKDLAKRSLVAWATGKAAAPFHSVRKWMEDGLGVKVNDTKAAKAALIDKGLVAPDAVKV